MISSRRVFFSFDILCPGTNPVVFIFESIFTTVSGPAHLPTSHYPPSQRDHRPHMSPQSTSKSVSPPMLCANYLSNYSQLTNFFRKVARSIYPTNQNTPKGLRRPVLSSPGEQTPIFRLMPKLRIPALSSLLKTITRQRPSPTQVLCNARSALLEDKSKLSQKHPLRRRVDKNNGALETIPIPRVPNREHVFPPTLPKRSLRGLSRAV
jgi:hypothetical protein